MIEIKAGQVWRTENGTDVLVVKDGMLFNAERPKYNAITLEGNIIPAFNPLLINPVPLHEFRKDAKLSHKIANTLRGYYE
ncbi:hypothetical protein [Macrococcus capreoli]|uniref:hypothetical protein n=1 Tax=Macrococcus capreoli TaxID=2982690 RepID=UPI0021D5F088|nr:hypothetical protein [Macrococcus sp. TMW 2.2395]MCU7556570.1 hypothetical protein [Macrococcus sp. TMW 2.2395]